MFLVHRLMFFDQPNSSYYMPKTLSNKEIDSIITRLTFCSEYLVVILVSQFLYDYEHTSPVQVFLPATNYVLFD